VTTVTNKWVANSTLLYDLDSLQSSLPNQSCGSNATSSATTHCDILLSNYMLSSGVNTLEKVSHRSGALTTNWNRLDFHQFKVFLNSWRELQSAAL
jgi:hypothetical protein